MVRREGDNSISPLPQQRNEGRLKGRDYYLYKTDQGFAQKKQIKIEEHLQAGDVIKERGTEREGFEGFA